MIELVSSAQLAVEAELREKLALMTVSAFHRPMIEAVRSAQLVIEPGFRERTAPTVQALHRPMIEAVRSAQFVVDTGLKEKAAFAALALHRPMIELVSSAQEAVRRFLEAGLFGLRPLLPFDPELLAIERAIDAAISGDRELVRAFVRTHLRMVPSPAHVEAAIDALLELVDLPMSPRPRERLRTRTLQLAPTHRLLGETQILGHRIDSLDRPLAEPTSSGTPLTMADRLTVPDASDLIITHLDAGRILASLRRRLTPTEQQVLAHRLYGLTWAEAARQEGWPASKGEAVRRKLRRLGEGYAKAFIQDTQRTLRLPGREDVHNQGVGDRDRPRP